MLEDVVELDRAAEQTVVGMLARGVAEKIFYTDERVDKVYPNLMTPNAFDKELVTIAVLGYPEKVGVWSYTLLRQSRISDSSMEPYFRQFGEHKIGLVAINPNFFHPDLEGDSFTYQLERVVAHIAPNKKMGFIGFSMGGRILVEYLAQRSYLIDRVAGLVLLDPVLRNEQDLAGIRRLLDNDTLLIASQCERRSPGKIASALLGIPSISVPGFHGEMPNKALGEVINFCKERKP